MTTSSRLTPPFSPFPSRGIIIKQMDLFAFINHADPTKVRIGERKVREGEVSLLELTRGRVVSLTSINDQGDVNIQDVGHAVVNEEGVVDGHENPVDAGINKRKATRGASGSILPPKKFRDDYGTSGAGASTGGKFLVALQSLLEGSTLTVEVGVAATATVPFVTSSVTLTPERKGVGALILSNAADAEVFSVVRSLIPDPPIMTTAIATTVVAAASSVPVPRAGDEPVHASIFSDSTSAGTIYVSEWNMVNKSALDDPDVCRSLVDQLAPPVLFSQLCVMDYDQLFAEFNVRAARQTCLSAEVRMRTEHILREKKKLEGRCSRQSDLLKEKDAEIASLKAQLSLNKAEAAEAIHLRGQVATVEAAEAARASELDGLRERNLALKSEKNTLEGQVAMLKSAAKSKDNVLAFVNAQVAKLNDDLSSLQLSFGELSAKAATLGSQKDSLTDQVSVLETTCSGLHDQVSGYELFKGQIKAVQDEQVKVLSGRVAELDSELVTEYLAVLGEAIGRAIMGWWLVLTGRGLVVVAAYNPSVEANYVSAVNALRAVDFSLLAQLESQKDASIADIMGLLHLEGPAAETPKANQLHPSPEQLMLHINQLKDQVVIGETSLSFSLDVVHARVQRIQGDAASRHLSLSDAMVPLIEPLFAENLVGEASTYGVPATATTTALSTTFTQTRSVPPILVADYEVSGAEPLTKVPSPPKIVFEKDELKTTPEHATAN
ncbi:hypothetical protein Tco_1554874 [Tanacetum coccineum]